MNNKGETTLTILIIILFMISMISLLFFEPILKVSKDFAKTKNISQDIVNDMNSKERLFGLIKNNISYEGLVNYEDLNTSYVLSTKDEDFVPKTLKFNTDIAHFYINNDTDINLAFEVDPVDADNFYYDVKLIIEGEDLLNNNGLGLKTNKQFEISKLYDKLTNETKYGEYKLIINTHNCKISSTIKYESLYYREILVQNDFQDFIIVANENISTNDFDVSITYKDE